MAFINRLVEFPRRYKLIDVNTHTYTDYDIEPDSGSVYFDGTVLNADNMHSNIKELIHKDIQSGKATLTFGSNRQIGRRRVNFPTPFAQNTIPYVFATKNEDFGGASIPARAFYDNYNLFPFFIVDVDYEGFSVIFYRDEIEAAVESFDIVWMAIGVTEDVHSGLFYISRLMSNSTEAVVTEVKINGDTYTSTGWIIDISNFSNITSNDVPAWAGVEFTGDVEPLTIKEVLDIQLAH